MEKYYNVSEISKITGKSEEQVRRWIRDGKLYGTYHSRKEGYKVSETDLDIFMNDRTTRQNDVNELKNERLDPIVMTSLNIRIAELEKLIEKKQEELNILKMVRDYFMDESEKS